MSRKARIKPSRAIRGFKNRCGVFDGMITSEIFAAGANQKQTKAIIAALKANHDNWWNCWIEPELQYLEKRGF